MTLPVSVWLARRKWDRRARTWDSDGSSGLDTVVQAVLSSAEPCRGKAVADLGSGTGQLAIPLARAGASVTAVDVSPKMLELLRRRAESEGIAVETLAVPIERLTLPAGSVDVIVSNYALHHLKNRDKVAVVNAAATWLRPGGRLVVGDLMLGPGRTARDRRVIGDKVAVMLRRGPPGWWRLAKNGVRLGLRLGERPASMQTWVRYFEEAGFEAVSSNSVVAEAAVVTGTKP